MALCDTQHAGKEIVTRPKSEYFANDPECHDLLLCALQSHRVAGLGGCPTGPPVGGVTSVDRLHKVYDGTLHNSMHTTKSYNMIHIYSDMLLHIYARIVQLPAAQRLQIP